MIELAKAQEQLAEGLSSVAVATEDSAAATERVAKEVYRLKRWLVPLVALAALGAIAVAVTFGFLRGSVHDESERQQTEFKCVVGVLFRQDPPACPGLKEELIRDGFLPPGFPATTTTRP